MIGSVMSAWLSDEGLSRSTIGLFGAVFAVYSFNFLWSPALDQIRLPWLGQRKGWIALMQVLIAVCCLCMSSLNAQQHLFWMALLALLIAIFSSTQDIAIDGYRIDIIAEHESDKLSAGSSMATAGWWTGYGGLGALPFFLVDATPLYWPAMYLFLAAGMLVLAIATVYAKEPDIDRQRVFSNRISPRADTASSFFYATSQVYKTIIAPFKEFFVRNGTRFALSVLLFIFLFKIGEAFLGRMSIVFYKEIGFSNSDIGSFSKLLNWWVTIVFSIVGGMINIRYGIYRGLMIAGIAMASSNLMFSWIATTGPDTRLLALAVIIDGFTAAWGTVAMVAFISLMCNKAFSATQYALMASLSVAGRTLLASGSGFIVDGLNGNWALFFAITALMVIPSLLFLYAIKSRIIELEKRATTHRHDD